MTYITIILICYLCICASNLLIHFKGVNCVEKNVAELWETAEIISGESTSTFTFTSATGSHAIENLEN